MGGTGQRRTCRTPAARVSSEQEANRTVITLPGNVLFASGEAMLMPAAQNSLAQVAEALKEQSEANIRVEGHTDSTGSDSVNMALSKERARLPQLDLYTN